MNIFGFEIGIIEGILIVCFIIGVGLLIAALASNDKKQRKHK